MCQLINSNKDKNKNDPRPHLFYKELTYNFHESCSAFIQHKNKQCSTSKDENTNANSNSNTNANTSSSSSDFSPRRRLFEFEDDDDDDETNDICSDNDENIVPFLNLIPNEYNSNVNDNNNINIDIDIDIDVSHLQIQSTSDPWMKNAIRLSFIIHDQSKFLSLNYHLYTNQYKILSYYQEEEEDDDDDDTMTMSNEMCHQFESNLVSFMTTTTKQIENLRQQNNLHHNSNSNSNSNSNTIYHHRNGIITNLYSELKSVMNVYSKMQSIRHRPSLLTLENPNKVFSHASIIVNSNSNLTTSSKSSILEHDSNVDGTSGSGTGREKSSTSVIGNMVKMKGKDVDTKKQLEALPMLNFNIDTMSNSQSQNLNQNHKHKHKQQDRIQYQKRIQNEKMKRFISKYHLPDQNYLNGDSKTNDHNNNNDNDNGDDDDTLIQILNQPLPSFPPKITQEERKRLREEKNQKSKILNINDTKLTKIQETKEEEMTIMSKPREKLDDQELSSSSPSPSPSMSMSMSKTISQPLSDSIPKMPPQYTPSNIDINNQQNQLEQETILLTNKIQNESLDSVQKVENQMIQITSLLNQFTSLINDQQVEIDVIHESAVASRDNVEKGNQQLQDAKESKKRSQHYFAWIIMFMGFILLFFNSIVP